MSSHIETAPSRLQKFFRSMRRFYWRLSDDVWEFFQGPDGFVWKSVLALAVIAALWCGLKPFADRGEEAAHQQRVALQQQAASRCAKATQWTMAQGPEQRDFEQLHQVCHPESLTSEERGIAFSVLTLFAIAGAMVVGLVVLGSVAPRF